MLIMFNFQERFAFGSPRMACKWSRNEVGEYIGINPFSINPFLSFYTPFTRATILDALVGQMQLTLRLPISRVDDDDSQTLEIIEEIMKKAIKSLLDLVLNNTLGDKLGDTLVERLQHLGV